MKHFKALMIASLPAAFGLQAKGESFGGLNKGFLLGGSARTSQTEQLPAAGLRGTPPPYPRETHELPEHVQQSPFEQGRFFAQKVLESQGQLTPERIAELQRMSANTNIIRMCATIMGSDHLNERMSDQRMEQDFPEFFNG